MMDVAIGSTVSFYAKRPVGNQLLHVMHEVIDAVSHPSQQSLPAASIFGDGSVRILKAPGHTPGSRMLHVRLSKSGSVLISGDVVHTREIYDKDLVPAVNISRADSLASSQRLRKIAANTHARYHPARAGGICLTASVSKVSGLKRVSVLRAGSCNWAWVTKWSFTCKGLIHAFSPSAKRSG